VNSLHGKVALITGAARGIGAEIAGLMVEAGARVVAGDIREEAGRDRVADIAGTQRRAEFVRLDVTRPDDWTDAVQMAQVRFGGLDILVNNAAIFLGRDIEEVGLDDWQRLVDVNLTGVFLGTKLSAPALRERGRNSAHGSAIVNMSSIAGLVGAPLDPLYSMTKGGVTLFTKSTALTFANKGDRIRVNALHPGVIDTDMGHQTIVSRAALTGDNDLDVARAGAIDRHPMKRLGTADDIARGAVFLASDDAGFMTGSSLVIDGGLTAQ